MGLMMSLDGSGGLFKEQALIVSEVHKQWHLKHGHLEEGIYLLHFVHTISCCLLYVCQEKSTKDKPAISVGNVGQLCCDLLIATLDLQKIGYFQPEYFLPLVGNNPFSTSSKNETNISLSSEVYHDSQAQITVLQIRSPIVKSRREKFRKSLLQWFKKCQFKELIILSSCHSYERTDEQLHGSSLRYLLSPELEDTVETFSKFSWTRLEERLVGYGDRSLFIPGGGFTKSLYLECCCDYLVVLNSAQLPKLRNHYTKYHVNGCSENISAAVLLLFCAEGDNIPEAFTLASHLNQWKQYLNKNEKWKTPSSWIHLFGNQPPSELF